MDLSVDSDGSSDDGESRPPLEPGSPSLENTVFLLLGILVALFLVANLV